MHEGDSVFVKIPGTISDTDWGITVVIDKLQLCKKAKLQVTKPLWQPLVHLGQET